MSWVVRVVLAVQDLAALVALEQERRGDAPVGVRVLAHTPPNLVVELSPAPGGARDMGLTWARQTSALLSSIGWKATETKREGRR